MSVKLATEHLISCMTDKDKYKGRNAYTHEVSQFNESIYPICNKALLSVLVDKHTNYMAKLMALRFFK